MLDFTYLHPRADDLIGIIPEFLSESDPRPAAEQFNERYAHGGGWNPMSGWGRLADDSLLYPPDELYHPVAKATLRDETIFIYENAWVAIVQPNGSFEVSRMD